MSKTTTESVTDAGDETQLDPGARVVVTLFTDQTFATRVGIATVIILFLLFAYYLIGGYTNNCGCGSGEHYQNCGCQGHSAHSAHSHPYAGHGHGHGNGHGHGYQTPPPSMGSNIYQSAPYLNF
jgi:hypothetical protein